MSIEICAVCEKQIDTDIDEGYFCEIACDYTCFHCMDEIITNAKERWGCDIYIPKADETAIKG